MNNKVRLLVVDDSIYMQMALGAMMAADPDIEIVGEASNGAQAIEMARALRPDVITMDVNMPGMDGLEATAAIMAETPTPIIMVSSLTEKGAALTFRALELGAVDYISKTASAIDIDLATIVEQVTAKVRFWGQPHPADAADEGTLPPFPVNPDLLVVAGGTGAPKLMGELLRALPDTSFPVLVAQEMSASFTSPFTAFLARVAKRAVHEAADGSALVPGVVTIIPGGRSWSLGRDAKGAFTTMLGRASQGAANSGLASAMATARAPLIICLSGKAHAAEGVAAIGPGKAATLWVQAPASCVVPDLPQAMIASGSRTVVLSPSALLTALRQPRARNAA